jgi:predicted amidohydrolase YtcJ
MKEALRAYTHTAAFAAFEEKEKGSIEEGKMADLAVWEQNLYAVRPEQEAIKALKVLMTILNGKIVYQHEQARFVSADRSRVDTDRAEGQLSSLTRP